MKAAHGEDSLKYSILYGLAFYLFAALSTCSPHNV